MHADVHKNIHVYEYAHTFVCIYTDLSIRKRKYRGRKNRMPARKGGMYVCMYVCMCVSEKSYASTERRYVCMYVSEKSCASTERRYVCMYVHMSIYLYIKMHDVYMCICLSMP